jgi:hypothetical protein
MYRRISPAEGLLEVPRAFFFLVALLGITPGEGLAVEQGAGDSFRLMPYLWAAQYVGTVGDGDDEGDTEDNEIFSDLSLTGFMLFGEWRRSRWSLFGDWTWAKVSSDAKLSFRRNTLEGEVEIKGHIVQGAVGYEVFRNTRSHTDLFGGIRYLHINAAMEIKSGVFEGTLVDGSDDWADAILGIRGAARLGDHWQLNYYADAGAGGSDFTWQAIASLGYGFGWGSLKAGWRHLDVDYDSGSLKLNAYLTGPFIGAEFAF